MKRAILQLLGVLMLSTAIYATELHVALNGNDANPGTKTAPLRTIQRGADLARAGDVITVHEGVYRERLNPPRGGESDRKRIVYQAAPGEKVEIKGSEIVRNWVKGQEKEGRVYIEIALGPELQQASTRIVTTALLGKARIPGLPYENPDGTSIKVDTDYFGKPRKQSNPTIGPFENPEAGPLVLEVW